MRTTTPKPQADWTVGGLLTWTAGFLAEKGVEFPRLDAEVLLSHVLQCRRIDLYGSRYAEQAGEETRTNYRTLIRRRLEGCPVAYLVGRKEFFSLALEVTPAVLIPRPDSETLVVAGLEFAKGLGGPRILDIGTGSGNLALALAKNLPGARVTATDITTEALEVARRNAERHGVAERVRFLHGDLYDAVPAGETFDLIVSNPPYIPTKDIAGLAVGVRDYEPHAALDGGPDGFAVFGRLVREAQWRLAPGGQLLIEIGSPQEARAREILAGHPDYQVDATLYDYSRHPRVLRARYRPG
jgi:release factor glutamine methyltransferase